MGHYCAMLHAGHSYSHRHALKGDMQKRTIELPEHANSILGAPWSESNTKEGLVTMFPVRYAGIRIPTTRRKKTYGSAITVNTPGIPSNDVPFTVIRERKRALVTGLIRVPEQVIAKVRERLRVPNPVNTKTFRHYRLFAPVFI
jgi:hypothetical protein